MILYIYEYVYIYILYYDDYYYYYHYYYLINYCFIVTHKLTSSKQKFDTYKNKH